MAAFLAAVTVAEQRRTLNLGVSDPVETARPTPDSLRNGVAHAQMRHRLFRTMWAHRERGSFRTCLRRSLTSWRASTSRTLSIAAEGGPAAWH